MVPKRAYAEKKDVQHNVLVWFHGGGYIFGSKTIAGPPDGLFNASSGHWLNSTDPDSSEDIIFVAINYRLGAFGWLAGDDFEKAGGFENAGLSDQLVALKWIQNHIADFGGNPEQVTVIGQSAGASSIMHHITSEGGEGEVPPFQQAIMQSPAFFPSADRNFLNDTYHAFLDEAGVKTFSELQGADTAVLMAANNYTTFMSPYGRFAYGPVVDGTYVPDLPTLLLDSGQLHRGVQIMIAHNRQEGALFTPPWIRSRAALRNHILNIFPELDNEAVDYITDDLYPINEGVALPVEKIQPTTYAMGDVAVNCNDFAMREALPNSYSYMFNIHPGVHGQDVAYTVSVFSSSLLSSLLV